MDTESKISFAFSTTEERDAFYLSSGLKKAMAKAFPRKIEFDPIFDDGDAVKIAAVIYEEPPGRQTSNL